MFNQYIGIDIAKEVFQIQLVDNKGKPQSSRRLSRKQLPEFINNTPQSIIAMEACGSSNYWANTFIKMGHQVRLIAPQFVKPFRKGLKNDKNDALAIAEAAQHPSMRFVPIKSALAQDVHSMHGVRRRLNAQRTALINQIRGYLGEYGVTIPVGSKKVRANLPLILEDAENKLTPNSRLLFQELYEELIAIEERLERVTLMIREQMKSLKHAHKLTTIPGVGFLSATYLSTLLENSNTDFKNGRHFAAYLGLVPRQYSSGNHIKLLSISKRGNVYMRWLLVHGARAIVRTASKKNDKFSLWVNSLKARVGTYKTIIAVANKNARIAWAVAAKGSVYQP